jgi:hypothetical protein
MIPTVMPRESLFVVPLGLPSGFGPVFVDLTDPALAGARCFHQVLTLGAGAPMGVGAPLDVGRGGVAT